MGKLFRSVGIKKDRDRIQNTQADETVVYCDKNMSEINVYKHKGLIIVCES